MPLSLHAITGMGPESQATRTMGREIQPIDRDLRGVSQGDEVKRSLIDDPPGVKNCNQVRGDNSSERTEPLRPV